MESLRRPSVLAALAAALLAISLVVLVARSGSDGDGSDPAADAGTEDTTADADQGGASGDGATDDGGGQAQDGAGDGAAAGQQDGEATGDDGAAGEDGAGGEEPAEAAGLGVPAAGGYAYASSGTWSLRGGEEPEEHQLPATATATVQVEGGAWQVRLAAGDDYADRLGFAVAADGGLDWTSWVLERQFNSGPRNETSYSCSGDSAYYRPDEQGRTVSHQCESDAGITSDGQVEHLGTEELTLGDGTVVSADRILHTYTVTGSGTTPDGVAFEVTGEGRLDLWLDPATGLRLREQRSISTTTTYATGGEQVYQEDVEFTLQSQQPS